MRWASNRKMVSITSPVERTKRISVPTTNMNENRRKSIVAQIGRYSDPDALADYIDSQITVRKSAATRLALDLGVEPPRVPVAAQDGSGCSDGGSGAACRCG